MPTPRPTPKWSPDGTSCITVTDNGTGMSPAVLSRAFEPFYSTKPRDKETGVASSKDINFLAKPFSMKELLTAVHALIGPDCRPGLT